MSDLHEIINRIRPTHAGAADAAKQRHAGLAKPPGSLGLLEKVGARLAAIAGRCPPPVPTAPALVVAAGDHGVHAEGVSPWPQDITRLMAETVCSGGAAASVLAKAVGAQVVVLDVGVAGDPADHPALVRRKVVAGTRNLRHEDAMSRHEAERAILAGAEVADRLIDDGADLLVTGDLGIANTTASAALVAAYTGASPEAVTGRGTGIDDETLALKTRVVADALDRLGGDPDGLGHDRDGLGVLAGVGGAEHAALAGVVLAGAARGIPVVLDGVIADAAALAAVALAPHAGGYLVAGHRSVEPGAAAALGHLGLRALIDLDLRLGEGTGALLAVPLVQAAARLLSDMATLEDLGVG